MQLIHALISAIANPVRQIYSWFMQIVPGLKAIAGSSLPFRVSLMTLLFLLIIWSAAVIKHFWTASEVQGELAWVPYVAGGLLGVIVIPIIAYYLTKYLMIREQSRYPEIDRIWYEALDECDRQGISLDQVPLFLGLGAPSVRFGGHLLKIAEMNMTVTVPKQGEGDISVYASSDAVFLFVSGCSCLSRLAAMPSESISVVPTPMPIQ
ncbi:MAG: hypothetical protein IT423_18185, partial [Pirellulaceae bacterium]|nr:hypothetical protein [Pirellulaceae bacterium]